MMHTCKTAVQLRSSPPINAPVALCDNGVDAHLLTASLGYYLNIRLVSDEMQVRFLSGAIF